ncbi:MAG: SDR family NAD(P)-dependent oxidoreductase [Candidatus Devosia euplotis]|nr:SDR family NAD(P)-dependent oxidoreductase [Candidatus Devosia euplotis]
MPFDFKEKVAIVTGAASGIDVAVEHLLASSGAKILVTDLNETGARDIAESIVAQGGVAKGLAVDVSDAVEVEAMVAAA